MACSAVPPGIENGQVVTFDSTQCTAVYSCDTGYAMVGSGVLVYPTGSPSAGSAAWSGSAQCELSFINNGKCLILIHCIQIQGNFCLPFFTL